MKSDEEKAQELRYTAAELATQMLSGQVDEIMTHYNLGPDYEPGLGISRAWTTLYGNILRELGGERGELSAVNDGVFLAGVIAKSRKTEKH